MLFAVARHVTKLQRMHEAAEANECASELEVVPAPPRLAMVTPTTLPSSSRQDATKDDETPPAERDSTDSELDSVVSSYIKAAGTFGILATLVSGALVLQSSSPPYVPVYSRHFEDLFNVSGENHAYTLAYHFVFFYLCAAAMSGYGRNTLMLHNLVLASTTISCLCALHVVCQLSMWAVGWASANVVTLLFACLLSGSSVTSCIVAIKGTRVWAIIYDKGIQGQVALF